MQVKISLLYNQFLARTNVALTSRMPCNSPYIFNYPLEYLAHWLFFGKFLSRASNTMPPRVRSPRPFCPCLEMWLETTVATDFPQVAANLNWSRTFSWVGLYFLSSPCSLADQAESQMVV